MQGVARGGITAELTLDYRPEVRAKAKVCAESASVNYHVCVDDHDSLPSRPRLRLSAWYQIRSVSVRMCGGWVSKTCMLYRDTLYQLIIMYGEFFFFLH